MVYLKPLDLARRTELIQGRKAVNWLKPHWLKLPLGFEHSLASFVRWTGRCCLYPPRGSYYKVFNEAWSSDLEPYGGLPLHCLDSRTTLALIIEAPTCWYERSFTLSRVFWPSVSADLALPMDKQNRSSHGRYNFTAHTIRWEGIGTWTGFPALLLCTLRRTTDPYILIWGSLIWIPLLTTCSTRCIWCIPTWFNHTRALVRSFRLQDLSSALAHKETDAHHGIPSLRFPRTPLP